MTDETMTVAGLVADLRDEVRRLTKERDKLRSALNASRSLSTASITLSAGPMSRTSHKVCHDSGARRATL